MRSYGAPGNRLYSTHLSVAVTPQGDRIIAGNYEHVSTLEGTVIDLSATAIRSPLLLSLSLKDEGNGVLAWTGAYSRYQLQRWALDAPGWTDLGEPTTNRASPLLLDGFGALFRVVGLE